MFIASFFPQLMVFEQTIDLPVAYIGRNLPNLYLQQYFSYTSTVTGMSLPMLPFIAEPSISFCAMSFSRIVLEMIVHGILSVFVFVTVSIERGEHFVWLGNIVVRTLDWRLRVQSLPLHFRV